MIQCLLISVILLNSTESELLDKISHRYSEAEGIQWEIESVVYSDIFDESDTTLIQFDFFPPDTFSISSEQEHIAGIEDTIWVMSKRHKQIQKKLTDGSMMPYNFILNWDYNYNIAEYSKSGNYSMFTLESIGDVIPDTLVLISDRKNRIRRVQYHDSKGDEVTMLFKKERLKRPSDFDKFYENVPDDYELIDLTQ